MSRTLHLDTLWVQIESLSTCHLSNLSMCRLWPVSGLNKILKMSYMTVLVIGESFTALSVSSRNHYFKRMTYLLRPYRGGWRYLINNKQQDGTRRLCVGKRGVWLCFWNQGRSTSICTYIRTWAGSGSVCLLLLEPQWKKQRLQKFLPATHNSL